MKDSTPHKISVRKRYPGEIIPIRAEHSNPYKGKEKNAAKFAIDLDLETTSITSKDSSGLSWLRITLDKVYCVKQVLWIRKDGNPYLTWSCSSTDCTSCKGSHWCSDYSVRVESEGAAPSRPVPGCKYGDSVTLQRDSGHEFYGWEIAVIGNQGENEMLILFIVHRLRAILNCR